MKPNNGANKHTEKNGLSLDVEQKFSLLILNTEEPFIIVNQALIIVSFNQQFKEHYQKFFGIEITKGTSILHYAQQAEIGSLKSIYNQALKGISTQNEMEILYEGERKIFLLRYKPAFDEQGRIIGVFVSSSDITEIKRSQEQLRASENRFRSLINNAKGIVCLTDKTGTIDYISPSIEGITGYTPEEMTGKSIFSWIHPDQEKTSQALLETILKNPGTAFPGVNQLIHKKGHYIWIEGTVTNLLEDVNVNAIVANYHDISHRKEIEEKLKENEDRLKAIIDNDPECVKVVDVAGRLLEMNPSGLKMIEAGSIEQIRGLEIIDLIHPLDKQRFRSILAKACSGENETDHFRVFTLKKNIIRVESHFVPLRKNNGEIYALLSVTRDVTERKKSQELLEANEKRYRALVENASDAIAVVGINGSISYVSPSVKKVLGYSEEEAMSLNIFNSIHPEDLEKIKEGVLKSIKSPGITIKGYTGRILHKDNSWRWCESHLTNMLHDIHIRGIVNNFRDVTKRIEAEQKLKHAESRFRTLIEHNYDGIVLRDENLSVIYSSSSAERILGWTAENKLGKEFSDKIHPDDIEKVKKNFEAVLNNPGVPFPLIFRIQHKEGHYMWIEQVMTNMLHDKEIDAIVANFRDITEKVTAEQKKEFDHSNLTALINNTNDLIWSISKTGVLISSNNAFEKKIRSISGKDLVKGELLMVEKIAKETLSRWQKYYERAFNGECFTVIEHTKESPESWSEISFYPIHNGNEIIGTACYSRDISERRRFEQKLENNTSKLLYIKSELESSEARLKKAQAIAHVGNWEINFETNNSIWSEELLRIYGLNPSAHKLSFDEWREFIHPEDRRSFEKEFQSSRKTLRDSSHTHRIVRKDGNIRHVLAETRFELSTSGRIIGLYGTVLDITDRVNTEKELVRSHELLEKLTSKVPVVMYKLQMTNDGKINFPFISDAILEFIPDLNIKELKQNGSVLFSKIHPEDLHHVLKSIERSKVHRSSLNLEFRAYGDQDKFFWLYSSSRPLENQDGTIEWYGYLQDITEKKLHDEKIRIAKERYDLAVKATNEAIWDWDIINGNVNWGEGFNNLFGHSVKKNMSYTDFWSSHLHPDDKKNVMNSIMQIVNSERKQKWEYEYRYLRSDGTYANVFDRGYVIRNTEGKAVRMIGAMQDITARKEEEQHLKLLESIITNTSDAVIITEAQAPGGNGLKIIYVNEALTRISGYSKEEILGNTPRMFQGPMSDPTERNKIRAAINNNEACSAEIINYTKNKKPYWVGINIAPVTDSTGKVSHFIAIERDITSRKIQEQEREKLIHELVQNNKDLRQFSYITSHNLRGPIANLLGLTNLLDHYKQTDPTLEKIFSGVKKAALNFDETIKDLSSILNIKDRPSIPKEEILFSDVHKKIIDQYAGIIKESNTLIKTDFTMATTVHFNKAYLESIYSNLLSNAIKYGKKIIPLEITVTSENNGSEILLKFRDTGRGIDIETHKDKLFGLYQRFHPDTEGKGLGLFLIKSQLESLGGSIEVESEVNKGTLFTLRFKNTR